MSSLLEQAFVDAKALKEAALKNAEATIVDKYSTEVKETLNKILEQDELGLGAPAAGMDPMGAAPAPAAGGDAAEDVPLGAAEGEELCACDDEGQETKIKINFDELAETLQRLEEELDEDTLEEDEEIELTEDDSDDEADKGAEVDYSAGVTDEKGDPAGAEAATLQANTEAEKELDEEFDMDSLVDAIMEKISLDEADDEPKTPEEKETAAKTSPKDKLNKGDFLPDDVQDELDESHCAGNRKEEDELDESHCAGNRKEEEELEEEEAPRKDPRAPRKIAKDPRGYMNAANDREFCRRNPNDPKCFYTKDSPTVAKDKKMARSYPQPTAGGPQGFGESYDADELIDAIMEKLTVDMGADLSGWAGRRAEDKMYEMEKALASRRSTGLEQETHLGRGMADRTDTDPQTELEDLKQAQEELVFENNQLKEKLQNYENVVEQLKESVTDVNLSNARLLYTNRVLRNTSLNERQKQKVAEAISKAGSVPEAKTIFETLQSTVESTPKRGPQSLSETINRRSSILRASNYSEAKKADPIADRMKKLAGIN